MKREKKMKKGLFTVFVLPTLIGMMVISSSADAEICHNNLGSSVLYINNNTDQGLIYATSQSSSGNAATTKSGFAKCPGQQTCIRAHMQKATMQACAHHTTCLGAGSDFIPSTVGTVLFVTRGDKQPPIKLSYTTSCAAQGKAIIVKGTATLGGQACRAGIISNRGYVKYYCNWNGY